MQVCFDSEPCKLAENLQVTSEPWGQPPSLRHPRHTPSQGAAHSAPRTQSCHSSLGCSPSAHWLRGARPSPATCPTLCTTLPGQPLPRAPALSSPPGCPQHPGHLPQGEPCVWYYSQWCKECCPGILLRPQRRVSSTKSEVTGLAISGNTRSNESRDLSLKTSVLNKLTRSFPPSLPHTHAHTIPHHVPNTLTHVHITQIHQTHSHIHTPQTHPHLHTHPTHTYTHPKTSPSLLPYLIHPHELPTKLPHPLRVLEAGSYSHSPLAAPQLHITQLFHLYLSFMCQSEKVLPSSVFLVIAQ